MLRAICSLSWAMPETPAPFIVGASRSGTTLLRLMLDAHPDLAIPPETEFILQVADLANGDNSHAACAFVDTLTSHRRWPDFHLDRHLMEAQVAALQPWNTGDALRSFYRLYAERFDKPRWGDKTPGYVKHTRAVQDYHRWAPERVAELVAPDATGTFSAAQRQSKHAWTSSPPEASRIGRWRTEMTADELSEYERVAGGLLAELGYAG